MFKMESVSETLNQKRTNSTDSTGNTLRTISEDGKIIV